MSFCPRVTSSVILSTLLASTLVAQTSRSITDPVEPFSLSVGKSFSASGSGAAAGRSSTVSRLSSDIAQIEDLIRQKYIGGGRVSPGEMTKNALTGALRSLDPHSNFYDAAEWKDLMDEEQSGYSGIGATISSFERNGVLDTYVLSTFAGSGAAKAQLRFGDRILAINGENVSGKDPDLVRAKLRGPEGTMFRLTVERAATLRPETVEIRRGIVAQPSVPSSYMIRPEVGLIELTEGFTYTTGEEMGAALRDLKKQGMRSLVLDLRGNGGGIVDQAVSVAERFLPSGTVILTQRGRTRLDNRVWRSSNPNPETMPLVLLVDENTASASEIVSGALQDNDRALIVGDRTFGKGLVQTVIDLPGKTGLTLTTARYLTPSGRSIQRDYSKLDNYDYFSHKTAAIDTAFFEARTITNRKVFGGDGIHPDEPVKSQTLTPAQNALLDPMFFFVRELVNGRIRGQETFRTVSYSPLGDSSLTDSFRSFVRNDQGWSRLNAAVDPEFVTSRVRYYAAMSAGGPSAADKVLIESDPQVAKAISILPRSAELARQANQIQLQRR